MIDLRAQRVLESFSKVFVCVALVLTLPVVASAHAKLVRSQPKANEALTAMPRVIELWFSEPLEPGLNTIEVKDQAGNRVDSADVTLAEDNKKALINLKQLAAGVYTVRWKALSADQHAMRGTFGFTVAESAVTSTFTPDPSQAIASPATVPHDAGPTTETGDSISWRQTLVRWFGYLAMMTLFGGIAFRLIVLVPAIKGAVDGSRENKLLTAGTRRVLSVTLFAAVLLLVTSILALILQASDVFDTSVSASLSPGILIGVLRTGYGPSWMLQVGSLLVLLILIIFLRTVKQNIAKRSSLLWWIGLVAGALLLAAPSWTGHARLAAEHFRLAVITDWLHLLAGGFWVGGLFHLALTWKLISSLVPSERRATLLHQVIKSFTRIAMPSVVLLIFAGFYNAWAHIPTFSALWITPYGQALALKLLIVLLMLVLGAINNYYFGKRAARLVSQDNLNANSETHLEHGFVRSVRFEATLAIVVLLVTAILVFLTPARNHPAMNQAGPSEKGEKMIPIGGPNS